VTTPYRSGARHEPPSDGGAPAIRAPAEGRYHGGIIIVSVLSSSRAYLRQPPAPRRARPSRPPRRAGHH
jgi:hypothetical protein